MQFAQQEGDEPWMRAARLIVFQVISMYLLQYLANFSRQMVLGWSHQEQM